MWLLYAEVRKQRHGKKKIRNSNAVGSLRSQEKIRAIVDVCESGICEPSMKAVDAPTKVEELYWSDAKETAKESKWQQLQAEPDLKSKYTSDKSCGAPGVD